jgi:hypothetical protein
MKLKEFFQHHKAAFNDATMSENADALFEKRLKETLHPPKKSKVVYLKYVSIAASIALLVSLGYWWQNQGFETEKQQLLASLENHSAGERLEGVYKFSDEFLKEDDKIIDALINILHDDKNGNVKIATIDALLKFPTNEKIRKNLIEAVKNETLPLVQIKLIKSLSYLREHRAQKPLENIINDEETFPIVKNNAALAMATLKQ